MDGRVFRPGQRGFRVARSSRRLHALSASAVTLRRGTSARAAFSPGYGRLLIAALFASLFSFFSPALPASAQEACAGVTVVVDFGALASDPVVGCAAEPSSGLDALAQAGFAVTEVASIRGMVCRIDALPEADCGGSPPADAYWSYWHAEAGDAEWTYSMVGGADASPDSGDVEGWAFGDGSTPPAIAPADAAPAAPQPDEEAGGASYTWLIAVAALAVIGALVLWRRRGRRA